MPIQHDSDVTGTIFNIQHYSVHDGPGIRTMVFCQGCSLSCRWCSNPESHYMSPVLAFSAGRCLKLSRCGLCRSACPQRNIISDMDNENALPVRADPSLCETCACQCATACPAKAFFVYGKSITVGEVLQQVEKDLIFYQDEGGVTISGGEPLMQPLFTLAMLRESKRRHLSTAIETTGHAASEALLEACKYADTVIYDIKHIDPVRHEAGTGTDNKRILRHFKLIVETFPEKDLLVRTPVIPDFNTEESCIIGIASLVKPYGHVRYELLPYHRLGTQKYTFLGRPYPLGDIKLENADWQHIVDAAKSLLGERLVLPDIS